MERENQNVKKCNPNIKKNYCKKKCKENKNDCSICLQSICRKKNETKLSCNHTFHSKCIDKWFKKDNRCPLCRKKEFDYVDDSNINQNNSINNSYVFNGHFCNRFIYQNYVFDVYYVYPINDL